jgi:hypothetical protein
VLGSNIGNITSTEGAALFSWIAATLCPGGVKAPSLTSASDYYSVKQVAVIAASISKYESCSRPPSDDSDSTKLSVSRIAKPWNNEPNII